MSKYTELLGQKEILESRRDHYQREIIQMDRDIKKLEQQMGELEDSFCDMKEN